MLLRITFNMRYFLTGDTIGQIKLSKTALLNKSLLNNIV